MGWSQALTHLNAPLAAVAVPTSRSTGGKGGECCQWAAACVPLKSTVLIAAAPVSAHPSVHPFFPFPPRLGGQETQGPYFLTMRFLKPKKIQQAGGLV